MKNWIILTLVGVGGYYLLKGSPKAPLKTVPTPAEADAALRNRKLETKPDASDYKTYRTDGNGEPVSRLGWNMSGSNWDTVVDLELEGWD